MRAILPPDEPDDYWTRTTSPDGSFVWIVSPAEWANSQWVLAGTLWRKDPASSLFNPPGDWSFESRDWVSPRTLKLVGRRFPGVMPGITLTLNVDALTGSIEIDAGDSRARPRRTPMAPDGTQPFSLLLSWLHAYPKE
jgi:hypothetical protein